MLRGIGGAAAGLIGSGLPGQRLISEARSWNPTGPVNDFDADVATAWFDLALQIVQTTPGFSPPVVSRAFGCAGLTLYEALVPGMPGYRSLAGQLNSLPRLGSPNDHAYHWPTVANSALATILRQLCPTAGDDNAAAVDALEQAITSHFRSVPPGIARRSAVRGRHVANYIFEWSRTDGGHEGYLTNFPESYVPPSGPGSWVPTPPGFLLALQPYWGSNRCFALASGEVCDPGLHPPYSEEPGSAFYNEALEVYEAVNGLTPEQREITHFWSDDPGLTTTPPGHSVSILNQVIVQQGARLDLAAEAYAKLGMALGDAFVACWNTKFRTNLLRPITYIQRHIDAAWGNPLPVTTPPFPEFTSGHSAQSGAAAQVLTDLFGDLAFTDHTHVERGLAPRSFSSFFAFADEAAVSRLYGGIHYRAAIELGVEQGRCIGRKVSALQFRA